MLEHFVITNIRISHYTHWLVIAVYTKDIFSVKPKFCWTKILNLKLCLQKQNIFDSIPVLASHCLSSTRFWYHIQFMFSYGYNPEGLVVGCAWQNFIILSVLGLVLYQNENTLISVKSTGCCIYRQFKYISYKPENLSPYKQLSIWNLANNIKQLLEWTDNISQKYTFCYSATASKRAYLD